MASLAVVAVAVLAGVAMAWAVGANSNSPPFAPAVAANALSTMRAAFLVGLLAGAGAVLQGGSISEAVGTSLITGVTVTPLAAAVALTIAAGSIAAGVKTGYPMPSAFATTGAVVGVGLGLGGGPAWGKYLEIGLFWLAVGPVAGGVAYATATVLRREDVPEEVGVPLLAAVVGVVVANMRLSLLPGDGAGTVAGVVSTRVGGAPGVAGYDLAMALATLGLAAAGFAVMRRATADDPERGIRRFLVGLGALVAFSSGGSQVGLATGPLESLFETELSIPAAVPGGASTVLLALGGLGILAGAWTGAPRLLQAVAREYSELGERRSVAALVPGFITAQAAITLGVPVSFNHIIISSVIGSGLVVGSAGVSLRKIGVTVAAWLATLVGAAGVGFLLYRGVALVVPA
ncbi:anion permease [Halobacteriales archaeon SW_5_70_135]|nr:MAG: anion permease [Halobacteriales archaeon SW_5_70_135]